MHHESLMHETTIFVTATYDAAHMPWDQSISPRALQLFNKRLRQELGSFRFFGVGEYGEDNSRAHYHVIYFGLWFDDAKPWMKSRSGELQYRSPTLDRIWGQGRVLFCPAVPKAMDYVARYTRKKLGGDRAVSEYQRKVIHPVTGDEVSVQVLPEFALMSRRPGIGWSWFQKFHMDAFPSDFVVIDGKRRPIPSYYLDQLPEADRLRIKASRLERSMDRVLDNTDDRNLTRHELHERRAKLLVRTLGDDDC